MKRYLLMKSVLVLLVLLYCTHSVFSQQRDSTGRAIPAKEVFLRGQVTAVQQYAEQGDLLFAARILRYIADESQDTLLITDALYGLITLGSKIAKRYRDRHEHSAGALYSFLDPQTSEERLATQKVWSDGMNPYEKEEWAAYRKEGIILYYTYYGGVVESNGIPILQELAKKYPNTMRGEWAAMRLVTGGEDEFGNMLEEAIEAANGFLEQYPDSQYRAYMYKVIGYSYADMLLLQDCDTTGEEAMELRQQSIKYLTMSLELESSDRLGADLERLEQGQCPYTYYLFGD